MIEYEQSIRCSSKPAIYEDTKNYTYEYVNQTTAVTYQAHQALGSGVWTQSINNTTTTTTTPTTNQHTSASRGSTKTKKNQGGSRLIKLTSILDRFKSKSVSTAPSASVLITARSGRFPYFACSILHTSAHKKQNKNLTRSQGSSIHRGDTPRIELSMSHEQGYRTGNTGR